MKLCDTLEETLNGGFSGLYGEVVTNDCYRLRDVSPAPGIIFDIGANVGTFTRHAQNVFPGVPIIAVEPNALNCAHLRKFTDMRNVHLYEAALGHGKIYHGTTARNGSGETYLSAGLGYPADLMDEAVRRKDALEEVAIETVSLHSLFHTHDVMASDWRVLLKIDCEGAENSIWDNPKEMDCLYRADYVCMEIHNYALNGAVHPEVVHKTKYALSTLLPSHRIAQDGVHFYAIKR